MFFLNRYIVAKPIMIFNSENKAWEKGNMSTKVN